jgi:hypothetical protein
MSNGSSTLTVALDSGALQVSEAVVVVPKGTTLTLRWIPEDSTVAIKFIGFYNPTDQALPSSAGPISTPVDSGVEGAWIANVSNVYNHQFTDHFFYTIYAQKNGVMYSTDPEVENESNPGG